MRRGFVGTRKDSHKFLRLSFFGKLKSLRVSLVESQPPTQHLKFAMTITIFITAHYKKLVSYQITDEKLDILDFNSAKARKFTKDHVTQLGYLTQ